MYDIKIKFYSMKNDIIKDLGDDYIKIKDIERSAKFTYIDINNKINIDLMTYVNHFLAKIKIYENQVRYINDVKEYYNEIDVEFDINDPDTYDVLYCFINEKIYLNYSNRGNHLFNYGGDTLNNKYLPSFKWCRNWTDKYSEGHHYYPFISHPYTIDLNNHKLELN